jgi:hypothetical protein
VDLGQVVAVVLGLLQTALEGVDDGPVALQREDQGHVDADALGQGCRDGFQALKRGRDLDVDVVAVDLLVEVLRFGDGAGGVPGEAGVHLDGDAAVDTVGCRGDRGEEVAGVGDVRRRDFEDGLFDGGAGSGLGRDGGVVVRAGGDGGVEDAGVRGDTRRRSSLRSASAACRSSERPRERSSSQMETPASESCWVGVLVISNLLELWGCCQDWSPARESLAAAATASAVMPNSWNRRL